ATDMLGEMAGEGQDPADQLMQPVDFGIARIEARRRDLFLVNITPGAPDGAGHPGRHILAQAQYLADLADGASRTIMDDGGGNTSAVAAIAAIDILHHFLAPLMLEIDINI